GRTVTDGGDHNEVTQPLEEIIDESARVLPGLDNAIDRGKRRGGITGGERFDDLVQQRTVRVAEQRYRTLVRHGIAVRSGDELVEQRQGVTGGPPACPHDQRQHTLRDLHTFFYTELLDVLEHRRRRHQ